MISIKCLHFSQGYTDGGQNGNYSADDMFQSNFLIVNFDILIKI